MSNDTLIAEFQQVAADNKWTHEEQLHVILSYIACCDQQDDFFDFVVDIVDTAGAELAELVEVPNDAGTTPAVPDNAVSYESIATFFSRSFIRKQAECLVLVTSVDAMEDWIQVHLPDELVEELRKKANTTPDEPEDAITGGWRIQLRDGSIVAFFVSAAASEYYIEAVWIYPEGEFSEYPEATSMRKELLSAEPFEFRLADGSTRLVYVK
jgi:hypothetical protein